LFPQFVSCFLTTKLFATSFGEKPFLNFFCRQNLQQDSLATKLSTNLSGDESFIQLFDDKTFLCFLWRQTFPQLLLATNLFIVSLATLSPSTFFGTNFSNSYLRGWVLP